MGAGYARLEGGLTMPGADGPQWEWLRKRTLELILGKVGSLEQLEKEAFRMAAGGEKAAPSLATRICITSYVNSGRTG